jgi:hypothetical protein
VRATDLRFTPEEAATFLTEVVGLPLAAEVIGALEVRTEGWIMGLQLAALSLQGRPTEGIVPFIAAFTGSHRYVLDYLIDGVLLRQPERARAPRRRAPRPSSSARPSIPATSACAATWTSAATGRAGWCVAEHWYPLSRSSADRRTTRLDVHRRDHCAR